MSEDMLYIHTYAGKNSNMCLPAVHLALGIFLSFLLNLKFFSAVCRLAVPAGGLYYGSIVVDSGRS